MSIVDRIKGPSVQTNSLNGQDAELNKAAELKFQKWSIQKLLGAVVTLLWLLVDGTCLNTTSLSAFL
jgi:hypothetical protein